MVAATLKMKRILVTGGGGQLARSLREICQPEKFELVTPSRKELDITDLSSSTKYISLMQPDVVINAAAWTDVNLAEHNKEQVFAVNTGGVKNLIDIVSKLDTRFIQISTDYVFGDDSKAPREVHSPRRARSIYGKSKLMAEDLVTNSKLTQALVIRTSWLYSRFGTNFPKTILGKLIFTDQDIEVVGDQFGQPTSAFDLSTRIFELLELEGTNGIVHATNSGETNWYEFARYLAALSGNNPTRIQKMHSPPNSIRPTNSVLSHLNWKDFGFGPMRNWKLALNAEFDRIILELRSHTK
jgi:dTDP-4-dehydrorhamnose reductase